MSSTLDIDKHAWDDPDDQSGPIPQRYMRRNTAAKYLACSIRTVDYLKSCGELPFYKLGRRLIVFNIDDLNAFMAQQRVDVSE